MAISSYFIGDYSINGYQWVPVNCFNQLITLILYDADQPNLRGDFCQGLKEALYHLQAFLLGSQGKYYIHWQFLCSLSKGVHLQFFLDKLHQQHLQIKVKFLFLLVLSQQNITTEMASLCETENCAHSGVGRWGDHRDYRSAICCHVRVSQIMLPCWDFTNYVATFWSSQILFSATKRKGKDVPI